MDTKILGPKGSGRNDVLYAMLLIAGVSATIFSVVGIAIITGVVPRAYSNAAQHGEALQAPSNLLLAEPSRSNTTRVVSGACDNCDVVKKGEVTVRNTGPGR
jgi:hypothetical protein